MNRARLALDALLGRRAEELPALLDLFLAAGCVFATHRDAAACRLPASPRIVFLRVDVDAPSPACRALLSACAARKVAGSWYFRRATIDPTLMRGVEAAGGEASFHYETVAEYAAEHGIASKGELLRRDFEGACLARLARDLARVRALTGLPCVTAASHGHALNRALGVPNNVLLEKRSRLAPLGLAMEAYDRAFIASLDAVLCDAGADLNGGWLYGETPGRALARGARRILLQLHPHHWSAAPAARARLALATLLRGPRRLPAAFRRI